MGTRPDAGTLSVAVSDELVRGLIQAQFPHLAGREIGRFYRHDHQVAVRLGDDFGVLFPTDPELADSFERAAPFLQQCAADWKFGASAPIAVGSASADFPYAWAVIEWLPGSGASIVPLNASSAESVARCLRQVHAPAPDGAPSSLTTARPLRDHRQEWARLLDHASTAIGPEGERVDVEAFRAVWNIAVAAPDEPPTWTHGAIAPPTVISDRGDFRGICDWLHFGAGDAAVDVAAASLLFPASDALKGRAGYGDITPAFRARTFGWRHLLMLRWIASANPFFWRYGWGRAMDFPQLSALGVSIEGPQRRPPGRRA